MVHGITKHQISKMNNSNVLSQGECCSYRVYILNRILRRRGFVCNDSTKHLKLLGMRVKVILDEVALQYISYYRAKDIILCANMRYITYQNAID